MATSAASPVPFAPAADGLVLLPHAALHALRAALVRDAGPSGVAYLQEAGWAAGSALLAGFTRWLAERDDRSPAQLDQESFAERLGEFLRDAGWGEAHVGADHGVLTVESAEWREADPNAGLAFSGCYFTAGMLGDFFTRLAGAQLAALEVSCRCKGDATCRWIVGSTEVIGGAWQALAEGRDWRDAV